VDCNLNGIFDLCDIASGQSPDCDTNAIPDECDTDALDAPQSFAASGTDSFDAFGIAAAVDGEVLLIGAYLDEVTGGNWGAVYVFRRDGDVWTEEQILGPSDGYSLDNFGAAVAVQENWAIIGAPKVNASGVDSGAAYVFNWDGAQWVEVQKLTASDAAVNDAFGQAVAISGNRALIGAPNNDDVGSNSGSAYVFAWNGSAWVEKQKLIAANEGAALGTSVAIDGDVALLGAPGANNAFLPNSGAVFVFQKSGQTWSQIQKLKASVPVVASRFGACLALDGDFLAIGAHDDDSSGEEIGSAYAFKLNGGDWEQDQKLSPPDGADGDDFGIAVSIRSGMLLVGANGHDVLGTGSGAAYVFERLSESWSFDQKLAPRRSRVNRWLRARRRPDRSWSRDRRSRR